MWRPEPQGQATCFSWWFMTAVKGRGSGHPLACVDASAVLNASPLLWVGSGKLEAKSTGYM